MMNLTDLELKQRAVVTKLNLEGNKKKHLMDMGIVRGTEITVSLASGFNGPIEILLRGCKLCLRRKDAMLIEVEKL